MEQTDLKKALTLLTDAAVMLAVAADGAEDRLMMFELLEIIDLIAAAQRRLAEVGQHADAE
jgi:hypothetical protein